MHAKRGPGPIALCRNPFAVALEEVDDARRSIEGLIGRLRYAVKKELEPGFPGATFAHFLEQTIVVDAVRLQIEAKVEQRFAQHAMHAEIQNDQEAANAPIAIEGMGEWSRTEHGSGRPW